MVIDVGYAVGSYLKSVFTDEMHTSLLKSKSPIVFLKEGDEWVSGNYRFDDTEVLREVRKRWCISSIVFTTYIPEPDKLIEPIGFERKILGIAVIKKGELVYGVSGYN